MVSIKDKPASERALVMYRSHPKGRHYNGNPYLRGCMGEDAFAHLFKLPYPTVHTDQGSGDRGIDFKLACGNVDVKATSSEEHLYIERKHLRSDYYVFTLWTDSWPINKDAEILGWLSVDMVKECETGKSPRGMDCYIVNIKKLKPIKLLYALEKTTRMTLKKLNGKLV